jgi:hypothetical protein
VTINRIDTRQQWIDLSDQAATKHMGLQWLFHKDKVREQVRRFAQSIEFPAFQEIKLWSVTDGMAAAYFS